MELQCSEVQKNPSSIWVQAPSVGPSPVSEGEGSRMQGPLPSPCWQNWSHPRVLKQLTIGVSALSQHFCQNLGVHHTLPRGPSTWQLLLSWRKPTLPPKRHRGGCIAPKAPENSFCRPRRYSQSREHTPACGSLQTSGAFINNLTKVGSAAHPRTSRADVQSRCHGCKLLQTCAVHPGECAPAER